MILEERSSKVNGKEEALGIPDEEKWYISHEEIKEFSVRKLCPGWVPFNKCYLKILDERNAWKYQTVLSTIFSPWMKKASYTLRLKQNSNHSNKKSLIYCIYPKSHELFFYHANWFDYPLDEKTYGGISRLNQASVSKLVEYCEIWKPKTVSSVFEIDQNKTF